MDFYYFEHLREQWSNFVKEPTINKYDTNIEERFPFLKYYENSEIAFAILNNVSFEMEYHSNNFYDIVGIDPEKYKRYNTAAFIDAVDKKHHRFFEILVEEFQPYWDKTPLEKRKNIIRTTFGLSMHHTEKGLIRLFIQTNVLEMNELNMPAYVFVLYRDVTYMMKDDFYWFRFSNLDKSCPTFAYHDELKELLKQDILSTREKEILNLICEGKTAEEIANQLFISKIIVNNHRQNMLNKIGVKDTTGLIMAAKICRLLDKD